jgi:hypothetical protein
MTWVFVRGSLVVGDQFLGRVGFGEFQRRATCGYLY